MAIFGNLVFWFDSLGWDTVFGIRNGISGNLGVVGGFPWLQVGLLGLVRLVVWFYFWLLGWIWCFD